MTRPSCEAGRQAVRQFASGCQVVQVKALAVGHAVTALYRSIPGWIVSVRVLN
jgi:hypothetical protein